MSMKDTGPEVLLTAAEMARADALAVKAGVPSLTLMENAGAAVADEILARFTPRPVCVFTGPGNNGGDGWVVARHLKERGWDVWVEYLTPPDALKGDAAATAKRFTGENMPIAAGNREPALFVDALFGAGISRPLEGEARRLALEVADFLRAHRRHRCAKRSRWHHRRAVRRRRLLCGRAHGHVLSTQARPCADARARSLWRSLCALDRNSCGDS